MLETRNPDEMLILLVEDREDDIVLFHRAFAEAKIRNPIFVVRDGVEATHYLAGTGAYSAQAEFPLPDLIVLDLKMPGMDGFELLSWIREHPTLKPLRIVVLTCSEDWSDVEMATQLGGNAFVTKPFEFDDYIRLATILRDHWFNQSLAPVAHRCRDFPDDD